MKRLNLLLCAICMAIAAHAQVPAMVGDIYPGKRNSIPFGMTVWNARLYFCADDSSHGNELWSYDEASSPAMVYDLHPGTTHGVNQNANYANMCAFKGSLYTGGAGDSFIHYQLLKYDGTNPPVIISGAPGYGYRYPGNLTVFNNRVWFSAQELSGSFSGDRELWSYDGVNPPLEHRFNPVTTLGTDPRNLIVFKGKLYLVPALMASRLYTVDASNNISPAPGADSIAPQKMLVAGSKMYFAAFGSTYGGELYSYDGIQAKRLTDVAAGSKNGILTVPAFYKGALYFSGSADGTNFQLYKFDTLTGMATLAYTVNTGGNAAIREFFVYKSHLYFIATTASSGAELWKYDGQAATMVADIWPGKGSSMQQTVPSFAIYNNHLYFKANDSTHGEELWRLNDPTSVASINWIGAVILHPNPAVTTAFLDITIPRAQQLRVSLTDINGRQVFTTGLQLFAAGRNTVNIPTANYASGQYFYRISGTDGQLLSSGSLIKR